MIVGVTVLALLLVPTVVDQVRTLASNLPQYLQNLQGTLLWLHGRAELVALRFHAPVPPMPDVKAINDAIAANASIWVGSSLGVAGKAVGLMGMAALVLMLAFFALLEGPSLRASLLALVPPPHRALMDAQIDPIAAKLGGYVQGMAVCIAGLAIFEVVVLTALGLPLALALGLFSALMAVVPLVGGILGVIPPALVALTVSWQTAVWALVLGYLGHFIVANFVLPLVFARSVKLSPLMVTVALLVGAEALGIFGALIAVPVAAALQVLVQNLYVDVMERAHAPKERDALKFKDAPLPRIQP
jgi:predicted PurR-regulated permease PerM